MILLQKKMNARMQDALDETLLLSDKYEIASVLLLTTLIVRRIIQDLVAQIICNAGALYKASESVSSINLSRASGFICPGCPTWYALVICARFYW
jgi:hypothetical protein